MNTGVSRRTMLRGAAITAAAGTAAAVTTTAAQAASAAPAAPAFPTTSKLPRGLDLETATVADLRPLLDSAELTSQTLTAAYLERIEALSNQRPAVNAVRMVNPLAVEEARAADQMLKSYQRSGNPYSPLLGIPVLIKDNIDATPMPTTAGSVALADSYPGVDAPLVRQLRAAGAVIIAKGNLTEFANYLTNGMPAATARSAARSSTPTTPRRRPAAPAPDRASARPSAWPPSPSAPRPPGRSSARRPPTPMLASSRPRAWSRAPGSCRSRPARTRRGRSSSRSRTPPHCSRSSAARTRWTRSRPATRSSVTTSPRT